LGLNLNSLVDILSFKAGMEFFICLF